MTKEHRSCLHDQLETMGARFVSRAGCLLAAGYSSVEEECRAVRSAAGVIDRTDRGFLTAAGIDAARFLHGMVTNEVQELKPGLGNYSCHLNAQGQILTDFHLLAMPDHYLLETGANYVTSLQQALDHYIIADDVELADRSEQLAALSVEGPHSGQLLKASGAASLPTEEYQHAWMELGGAPTLIVRLSDTGEEGYRLIFVPANAETIWNALLGQQEAVPRKPVGFEALNVLRTEAGIPWMGAELTEKTLPPEARLEARAISYTKGCYLGQEIVERIRSRGNVNRLLCGLLLDDETLPAPRTKLLAQEKEVGWITTAVHSPTLGRAIALGYLRREHSEPGMELSMEVGGAVKVTEIPFL
jgi:folate-binding protein YgfZ